MRGHDALISMREHGRVPSGGVSIALSNEPHSEHELSAYMDEGYVAVWMRPGEKRPELHFLVGLPVVVYAADPALEGDVLRVCELCTKAKAKRVVGALIRFELGKAVSDIVFEKE